MDPIGEKKETKDVVVVVIVVVVVVAKQRDVGEKWKLVAGIQSTDKKHICGPAASHMRIFFKGLSVSSSVLAQLILFNHGEIHKILQR